MSEELQKLLNDFKKKLEEAQDARSEVLSFLQEKYGIDTDYEADSIEESCDWCYGIDEDAVKKLIKKQNK